MRESGLEEEARAVRAIAAGGDLTAVTAAGGALGDAMRAADLPAALVAAVGEAYTRLCEDAGSADVPVAVRSSGVAEDLAGASFAGQYDTYLWVIGIDAVLDHVRRCWTGLFGPQVLTYNPGGAGAGDLDMAVVVQILVRPRAAGVMFTLDPVTGDRSKIVIESAWGLGEAVVSGEVTPDRFRVDKVTLEVIERAPGEKASEYRFEPGRGVRLVPVEEERRGAASLADDHIADLAALAKRIERHRGAPQDIEWAVDEAGAVHVLQVRPETVWSNRKAATVAVGGASAVDLVLGMFTSGGRLTTKGDGTESET
jgi:pyruvate,water dikinase